MSAPAVPATNAVATRKDVEDLFHEVTGKWTKENLEQTREANAKHTAEIKALLEAHNKASLLNAFEPIRDKYGNDTGDVMMKPDASQRVGLKVGQFFRMCGKALRSGTSHAHVLDVAKSWAMKDRSLDNVVKAMETQVADRGGLLVPEEVSAEIVDLLRAQEVVRASGCSVIRVGPGGLRIPAQTGADIATYVGERQVINESTPSLGSIKLSPKKLAGIVRISNEMLDAPDAQADAFVRRSMVRTFSLRSDLAMLRDPGSENTPKGMRFLAPASNVFDRTLDTGAVTLETVASDLARCPWLLEDGNVPMVRPGWLLNPMTYWFLYHLLDGNGQYVFRPEISQGMLFGWPMRRTTSIPRTLGGGGDESELYFADFDSLVIGVGSELEIVMNGMGTSFNSDETLIRGIEHHDFGALFRGSEIVVCKSLDWTPVFA